MQIEKGNVVKLIVDDEFIEVSSVNKDNTFNVACGDFLQVYDDSDVESVYVKRA